MDNRAKKITLTGFLILLVFLHTEAQEKDASVFYTYRNNPSHWMKYSDTSNALYHQIAAYAEELLQERDIKVSALNSKEEWSYYVEALKGKFQESLTGFKKTPLNATITGIIEREDFTIEKVVYESLPGFYVTGVLMVPKIKKQDKLPAVLIPTGHSQAAFRRDIYQHSSLNLVKKGFIVFTFDPLGQGERVQYLDSSTNQSYIGGSTLEHSYAGAQCLLSGNSISDYFIWDGVRAVDFLCSRPEVDTTRIGMTGVSGGGTQAAFVTAFDDRVFAAAPECYITSYHRLFQSIGPQDAEQNLYKGLVKGVEHADLLTVRAPRPTVIISTTQDFFSIQGARETYAKAKEVFTRLGYPESITMIEADGTHGSNKENRQGMYNFFQRELNLPGDTADLEVEYFKEEELIVTQTGQVASAFNSKMVFDLNREKAVEAIRNRQIQSPEELFENKDFVLAKIQELAGYDSTRRIKSVVYTGKIEKENYKIEKYFIQGHDFNYPVPFVLIKPYTNKKKPLLLYLDAGGKAALTENEETIDNFIEKGYTILAPDLIGTGELANRTYKGDSYIRDYSFNLFIGANLVGKSIAGMQAADLDVLFKYIHTLDEIDADSITAIVKDELCSSYLHFAAFNKNIKRTVLMNPLLSFEDLVTTRNYEPRYLWTAVPEAIRYYDLPFLQALLAPQELVIVNPVNAHGDYYLSGAGEEQFHFVKEAYKYQNSSQKLKIRLTGRKESPSSFINEEF